METSFEQARQFFADGVRDYEAGRFAQAESKFEASLALVPGRPSTLTNLGAARVRLGKFADAAAVLDEATRADPSDSQAWGHLATALAELGRHQQAESCADRALALDADLTVVWTLKGNLLRESGRYPEAATCFRQAIETGGEREINGYFLAAVDGSAAPAQGPRPYVQALFDSYAQGFEQHLTDVLHYDAPQVLTRGLGRPRYEDALDLGCGTGLVGEHLRARCGQVVGVDLSASMVAQARARGGVYAEVAQGDIVEFLEATTRQFDLVVAADVFIYVGELEAVFAAVARRLRPGGEFAFTVELSTSGRELELRPSLRYAHSRASIESLARRHGFVVRDTAEHTLREEQGRPIAGLFFWLTR